MSRNANSRRRVIAITDLLLIPVFLASGITGLGLHVAGHRATHEVWENWATAHVIASTLMLLLAIYHVYAHWAWYKSWFKNGRGKKSGVTMALTLALLFLVVTGIILLAVITGPNSGVGISHLAVGVLLIILSTIHILKRIKALTRMLKK